jgi:hypothetical protein
VSELGEILAVRGTQHGPFRLHAGITQPLKEVMEDQANWDRAHLRRILRMIKRCTPPNLRHRFPWSQPPSPLFRSAEPTQECASHPPSEQPI